MKILILNRFDRLSRRAGGAEIFTGELARRLVRDGHSVTWFASRMYKATAWDNFEGVKIIRRGNMITVLVWAFLHYLKNKQKYDLVIDEIHAYPFFTRFYVAAARRICLVHEVTDGIWYYMFIWPVAAIGDLLERIMYRFFYNNERFLTVSNSTLEELAKYGARKENITVLSEGLALSNHDLKLEKTEKPTIIYVGGLRPAKRVEHQLAAMKLLKQEFPYLKLLITGHKTGRYYAGLKHMVENLGLQECVEFKGFVSTEERDKLIASSWMTLSTSVKEGWGLAVSEAGYFGTPAVVYKTAGNIDSVRHLESGLYTIENNPEKLALAIKKMILDNELRAKLSAGAREFSGKLSWEKGYRQLKGVLGI